MRLESDRRVERGLHGRADVLDRVPVLAEPAGLAGREPAEVGLVVGEDPRHELDVGSVAVGEVAIPGAADLAVAPGPLLLAGGDRPVGPVHESGTGVVIVAAEEVVGGVGDHVRRRHRDVRVHVDAVRIRPLPRQRGVVHAVVRAIGPREGGDRPARVVGDVTHVGREERLVVLVRACGDVRPPQEGLRNVRAVREACLEFDQRRVAAQADAVRAAHALHRVQVAVPHRDRAVVGVLDVGLDGEERRRAVVLRPVELHAAGDPWAGQAHERRLDDVVPVEEVVVAGLVVPDVDAAAELRQQHEAHPPVLEVDGAPCTWCVLGRDAIDERDRIDAAARALVDPAVEEERVAVGLARLVRLDDEWGLPAGDAARRDAVALPGGGIGKLDSMGLGAHTFNGRRMPRGRQ